MEFMEEPYSYLKRREISLNNDELAWLMFYFSEYRIPIRYKLDTIVKNARLRRQRSVQANLQVNQNKICIELNGKQITANLDAKKVFENLLSHEDFTASDVLEWDRGFDWCSVRSFLHTMLEELILCYAPK